MSNFEFIDKHTDGMELDIILGFMNLLLSDIREDN